MAGVDQAVIGKAHLAPQELGELAPSLRASARFFMFSLVVLGAVVAWTADAFLGLFMVCAGLFGWRGFNAGLIKSLLALCGLLAMSSWALPCGRLLAGLLDRFSDWPRVPVRHVSVVVAAALILLCGYLLGNFLNAYARKRYGGSGRVAHFFGMCCGMLEGFLLGTIAIAALMAVEPPTRMGLSMLMEDSRAARSAYRQLLRLRQASTSTPIGTQLNKLYRNRRDVLEMGAAFAVVSKYPRAVYNVKSHPDVRKAIDDNFALYRVSREIKYDYALRRAVMAGDWWSILDSPTVLRILDDDELAGALEEHREELFEAILVSVPDEYRSQANEELARLHGLPVGEFKAYALSRIERARGTLDAEQRGTLERMFDAGHEATGTWMPLPGDSRAQPE